MLCMATKTLKIITLGHNLVGLGLVASAVIHGNIVLASIIWLHGLGVSRGSQWFVEQGQIDFC